MRNKILIFAFLLLLAALPVLAATTIDFESPTYATGELVPQDGWFLRGGTGANITVSSATPLSGSQSLSGTGNFYADRDVITEFDKTTLSMLVKISAGTDTFIYLEDGYATSMLWMRMSVAGGLTCNTTVSGTKTVGAMKTTDIYKLTADFDFPNHTVTVTLASQTDGKGGTATLTLPTNDAGGFPITTGSGKKVGVYQGNGAVDVVQYDDIKLYETPPADPLGVIDFENDGYYDSYSTGNLVPQNGWITRSGAPSNITVSSTGPISGLQSLQGTGAFSVDHPLVTSDVCSLSMLVKLGAASDTTIYLKNRFLSSIMWIRMSAAGGLRCNTAPSGTLYVTNTLVAGTTYKLNVDYNFTNQTAVVSLKDLSVAESNFEAPLYTTGDLAGQAGWIKRNGTSYTDMSVTATDPISGAQSLIGSPNDYVYKAIPVGDGNVGVTKTFTLPTTLNSEAITGTSQKLLGLYESVTTTDIVKYDDIKIGATSSSSSSYEKTTLSVLVKFDSVDIDADYYIYLTDRYVDAINWIRIVQGTLGCWTSVSGPQYMPVALTAGDVYKIEVKYNFTSLTAVLSLTDMTTSTYLGTMTFKLPAKSLNAADLVTPSSEKRIAMYNFSQISSNIMFDDFSITPSTDVATSNVTGSLFLFNYDFGDITTVPISVDLNGVPYYLNLDALGNFTIYDVPNDTYDVLIKASHWLAKGAFGVDVSSDTYIGELDLINGDVEENNEVDFSDINAVRAAYGSFPEDETWNWRADVDGSGEVDFSDINIVRSNYGEIGD